MSYLTPNDFPHSRNVDSDLRYIVEMYFQVKDLPEQWAAYQQLMNGDFSDLKNFVNQYFDNLDVQDEINSKLDMMASNGTLADLISTVMSKNIMPTTKINCMRYGGIPVRTDSQKANLQGACWLSGNLIFQYYQTGTTEDGYYEIMNIETGEVSYSSTLELTGHGNGAAYNGTVVALAGTSMDAIHNNVAVFNPYSPTDISYHDLSNQFTDSHVVHAILWNGTNWIVCDQNNIASNTQNKEFYVYDENFNYTGESFILSAKGNANNAPTSQGIFWYNGQICVLTLHPNAIFCFDYETKSLVKVINFERHYSDGMSVGEIESIMPAGDTWLISSRNYVNNFAGSVCNNFGWCNPNVNNMTNGYYTNKSTISSYYVSQGTPIYTANGRSIENGFSSIYQALSMDQSIVNRINVSATYETESVYLINENNRYINFTTAIGALYCRYCSGIILGGNLTITKTVASALYTNGCCVLIENSNINALIGTIGVTSGYQYAIVVRYNSNLQGRLPATTVYCESGSLIYPNQNVDNANIAGNNILTNYYQTNNASANIKAFPYAHNQTWAYYNVTYSNNTYGLTIPLPAMRTRGFNYVTSMGNGLPVLINVYMPDTASNFNGMTIKKAYLIGATITDITAELSGLSFVEAYTC